MTESIGWDKYVICPSALLIHNNTCDIRECGGGGVGRAVALPLLVMDLFFQMARKCNINGETLTITFVCFGQTF